MCFDSRYCCHPVYLALSWLSLTEFPHSFCVCCIIFVKRIHPEYEFQLGKMTNRADVANSEAIVSKLANTTNSVFDYWRPKYHGPLHANLELHFEHLGNFHVSANASVNSTASYISFGIGIFRRERRKKFALLCSLNLNRNSVLQTLLHSLQLK